MYKAFYRYSHSVLLTVHRYYDECICNNPASSNSSSAPRYLTIPAQIGRPQPVTGSQPLTAGKPLSHGALPSEVYLLLPTVTSCQISPGYFWAACQSLGARNPSGLSPALIRWSVRRVKMPAMIG